nr:eukaryotic translation initiation factor 3 subunit I-like [Lytechinus pictus]
MKPIALFGHERSITQIKYNREGDLLFSTAKDTSPNIWYSINGERLGTFNGHGGAVWCIDVDWDSRKAITGSADNTMRMWDIKTGKCTVELEYKSAVRTCGFSYSSNYFFTTTDRTMGQTSDLCVYDERDPDQIGCKRDKDGYYWITGRIDDMFNVSGHLLSTAEIESAIIEHSKGAEFDDALILELKKQVRTKIGPFAAPEVVHNAPGLPKTRSGKIMRRILRKIAVNDHDLGDVSTMADSTVVDILFKNRPQELLG